MITKVHRNVDNNPSGYRFPLFSPLENVVFSYGKDCFLTEETTFSQGENTVIHKGQQMRGGKNEKVCSILFIYRQARSG
jgi:hypothetical protein